MATSNRPVFAQGGLTASAIVTAAKTTYNDLANAVLLYTAGANGAVIKQAWGMPLATVTASKMMLFIERAGSVFLVDSALMAAHTVAATTATPMTYFTAGEIRLAPGDKVFAASGVAASGGICVSAQIEEY